MAIKRSAEEQAYVNKVTNWLVEKGREIVAKAIKDKEPHNITLNQVDAYGIIVYYNGHSVRSLVGDLGQGGGTEGGRWRDPRPNNISPGMLKKYKKFKSAEGTVHKGWKKYNIPDGTGFEWARTFARDFKKVYKPVEKGFTLVVFNAAFYSNIHEHGAGPGQKEPYKVLSQIYGDVESLARQFRGAYVRPWNLPVG